MEPTSCILLVKLADDSWVHTNDRQQVISVIESPSNTFRSARVLYEHYCLLIDGEERINVALTDFDLLRRCGGNKAGSNE